MRSAYGFKATGTVYTIKLTPFNSSIWGFEGMGMVNAYQGTTPLALVDWLISTWLTIACLAAPWLFVGHIGSPFINEHLFMISVHTSFAAPLISTR
jgi:hypothetical protein